ncbi:MAG: acyl-CoA thioesterase [Bacteroidaceae bacterium]|nr:acyl-CoA thioesterase [Bacteroidaceae bacterium]MBP5322452.1 acyl-CoA thioesterase [Bacteroidaceae bacterium]
MKPYIHKVKYYETDRMQVTHHSNYIRFMEEARIDFMEQADMGYEKMEAEGVVSPVMSVTCDYRKPTTFPDEIEIEVRALELSRLKLRMAYTMRVKGEVVCTATSLHCFLRNGRPISLEEQFPAFYQLLKDSME